MSKKIGFNPAALGGLYKGSHSPGFKPHDDAPSSPKSKGKAAAASKPAAKASAKKEEHEGKRDVGRGTWRLDLAPGAETYPFPIVMSPQDNQALALASMRLRPFLPAGTAVTKSAIFCVLLRSFGKFVPGDAEFLKRDMDGRKKEKTGFMILEADLRRLEELQMRLIEELGVTTGVNHRSIARICLSRLPDDPKKLLPLFEKHYLNYLTSK